MGSRKILITGATGQVGSQLAIRMSHLGQIILCNRALLDLSDSANIASKIREFKPDIILNAAAYTAVERAEEEQDLAHRINTLAPTLIADEADKLGALVLHYSTDYVFDGTKKSPYTEKDSPHPLNTYGRTKFLGEEGIRNSASKHLILRTSWVYGMTGHNFLKIILKASRERDEIKVVNDQWGCPTWAPWIAQKTAQIVEQALESDFDQWGTYHLSAAGPTTWFEFANAILNLDPRPQEQKCKKRTPISTAEWPSKMHRPLYTVLDCSKIKNTFQLQITDWREQLSSCFAEAERSVV